MLTCGLIPLPTDSGLERCFYTRQAHSLLGAAWAWTYHSRYQQRDHLFADIYGFAIISGASDTDVPFHVARTYLLPGSYLALHTWSRRIKRPLVYRTCFSSRHDATFPTSALSTMPSCSVGGASICHSVVVRYLVLNIDLADICAAQAFGLSWVILKQ